MDDDLDTDSTQALYESIYRYGAFQQDRRSLYKRPLLLEEEDLKIDFKQWICKNLRTLTVIKTQNYLNNELLLTVGEDILARFGIELPVTADTAHRWMAKCNSGRIGNNKTYYNNHHENYENKVYQIGSFKRLFILHKRMKVWYLASEAEQAYYVLARESLEAKVMFPVGEKYVANNGSIFLDSSHG